MAEARPRSDINRLLQKANVAQEGLVGQWRRALAVTAHERLAIVHLWECGPLGMGELADRIPVSRASMTAISDRLESLGYLRRSPGKGDRRRVVLEVSDLPFAMLAPIVLRFTEDLDRLASSLDDDQWQAVAGFLEALHRISHRQAEDIRAMSDQELARLTRADRLSRPTARRRPASRRAARSPGRSG